MEWSFSLGPPSGFGLDWIHAFEGTLELLEAAFLGKFTGSIQPFGDYNLLADDRSQICDMAIHHLAVLHPLLNKCFEPFHCRPLQERCSDQNDDERWTAYRVRSNSERLGKTDNVPLLKASSSLVTFTRLA
jgi:hypothetical protein